MSWSNLRSFGNIPGNFNALLWTDPSDKALAAVSVQSSGNPDMPGIIGTIILETDESGVPKNRPQCYMNDMEGITNGLTIRPLYVDSNPFTSAFLNNKTISEDGEITNSNLTKFSQDMAFLVSQRNQ